MSEFHMPGAYHFDSASGQTLNAGIFRPPGSPSSSVYNLAKSGGSLYSDLSIANSPLPGAKRKRTRTETRRDSTPLADWLDDARDEDRPNSTRQIRYTLAGQIDTPGGAAPSPGAAALEDSVYSDVDYRRALGSKRQREDVEQNRQPPLPQADQTSNDASADDPTPSTMGWSTLALSTIGEVVGRVWEFCKAGAFRGFHAGGGTGYEMDQGRVSAVPEEETHNSQDGRPWCNEHDVPTLQPEEHDADDETAPLSLPGSFLPAHLPPPDYPPPPYVADNPETINSPDGAPRPASKRRQLDGDHEELRRNWVLVGEEPSPYYQPPDPGKQSVASPPANTPNSVAARRPNLRYSAPTAASNSRRLSIPVSRLGGPTSTPTPASRRTSLRISHAGSPSLSTTRSPAGLFSQPRSPSALSSPTTPTGAGSRIPVPSGLGPNPFAAPAPGPSRSRAASTVSRPSSRQSAIPTSGIPTSAIPSPASRSLHRRANSSLSASGGRRGNQAGNASVSRIGGVGGPTSHAPTQDGVESSPRLDAEARQLAQRRRAAERDADARMEAFNKQLMDMIRQGKEALGTTVDVEMDMGAGWADDEV